MKAAGEPCCGGMRARVRLEMRGADEQALERLTRRGWAAARVLRRARVLQLLAEGWTVEGTASAVGVSDATVRSVRRRYRENGLRDALYERPRPGKERRLNEKQASLVVAMVCGPPPEGHARWTTRLIAQEVMRRG